MSTLRYIDGVLSASTVRYDANQRDHSFIPSDKYIVSLAEMLASFDSIVDAVVEGASEFRGPLVVTQLKRPLVQVLSGYFLKNSVFKTMELDYVDFFLAERGRYAFFDKNVYRDFFTAHGVADYLSFFFNYRDGEVNGYLSPSRSVNNMKCAANFNHARSYPFYSADSLAECDGKFSLELPSEASSCGDENSRSELYDVMMNGKVDFYFTATNKHVFTTSAEPNEVDSCLSLDGIDARVFTGLMQELQKLYFRDCHDVLLSLVKLRPYDRLADQDYLTRSGVVCVATALDVIFPTGLLHEFLCLVFPGYSDLYNAVVRGKFYLSKIDSISSALVHCQMPDPRIQKISPPSEEVQFICDPDELLQKHSYVQYGEERIVLTDAGAKVIEPVHQDGNIRIYRIRN